MSLSVTYDIDDYVDDDGFVVDRVELEDMFLMVTGAILPSEAEEHDYPINEDHCFQRVCYDVAYGDEWYDYVDGNPAYRNIEDSKLVKAVGAALYMMNCGCKAVERLNEKSLYWRGEIGDDELQHHKEEEL